MRNYLLHVMNLYGWIYVHVLQRYKLAFIPQVTSHLDLGGWEFMASVISSTLAGQILDTSLAGSE